MPKISKRASLIINVILFLILVGFLFFVWESDRGKKIPMQEESLKYKIYKNNDFGFEVKYPENWSIDSERSDENRVVFNTDKPGSIEAISFKNNEEALTFEKIIEKERENYKQVIKKEEFISIDNKSAWRIDTTEFGITRIFFVHGNFQYEIESMGYLNNDDILNSFNFLDEEVNHEGIVSEGSYEPAGDGMYWFIVKEMGIKFKVKKELKDDGLVYYYEKKEDYLKREHEAVYFSTKFLESLDKDCSAEYGPMGAFAKYSGKVSDYKDDKYIQNSNPKQLDGFFVYIEGPQAPCSEKQEEISLKDKDKWPKNEEELKKMREGTIWTATKYMEMIK
jgi:hypothetical protein